MVTITLRVWFLCAIARSMGLTCQSHGEDEQHRRGFLFASDAETARMLIEHVLMHEAMQQPAPTAKSRMAGVH